MSNIILDIFEGIKSIKFQTYIVFLELKLRYRRSIIGPFWITLSTGILIGSIGLIFSQIFNLQNNYYFLHFSVGMILWLFISSVITESCNIFVENERIIKNEVQNYFKFLIKNILKNLIIFSHNFLIVPIVFFLFSTKVSIIQIICFLIGMLLLILILIGIQVILSIFATRFRDFMMVITSLLQVVYFVSPILWMPELLTGKKKFLILEFNPIYHLLEITRAPLIKVNYFNFESFYICILFVISVWIFALILYSKYKNKIIYWI